MNFKKTWEQTHKMTIQDLKKEDIWRVLENVAEWNTWDKELEFAQLHGPFASGTQFTLRPKGGPKVKIQLYKVEPNKGFTDLTQFPLAKMYGIHEMQETTNGLEFTHTIRIEGPLAFLWRKLVGQGIADGLETQAHAMVKRARDLKQLA